MRTPAVISFVIISLSVQSFAFEIDEFFPDERNALIQLRDIVNSTFNLHGNWTGPPCKKMNESRWAGITCTNWHVTDLVLEGIQMTGSLPPIFLQNLTFLNKLSFRNNSLYGPLPNLSNVENLEFVYLSRNYFSDHIPLGYIDIPKLTELELQENNLSGTIPPFNQQFLTLFNVSHNQLEGPIPGTPVLQKFTKSSYDNNPALCGQIPGLRPCPIFVPPPYLPALSPSPTPPRKKDSGALKTWGLVLIAAGAALVPLSIILIFLCYYRRVYLKETKQDNQSPVEQEVFAETMHHWSESRDDPKRTTELEFLDQPVFGLDDLLRASAEAIGKGKISTTYKAMLECGSVVAVKRMRSKEINTLGKKEFTKQIHLLGRFRHENLVQIISFYHSKEENLIIYDYVPNGSLFSLLHENRGVGRIQLNWNARVSIIKDIAEGMDFLHRSLASHMVSHGNLKSSNVLIQRVEGENSSNNTNLKAKLSDYGLLPLVPADRLAIGRTPEFEDVKNYKKLTNKADVYCFGILVLEIVTGRVPMSHTNSISPSSEGDLSGWVRAAVNNDWSTDILDVEIVGEKEGYDEMLKLAEIALDCTDALPERRPKMSQVLSRIMQLDIQLPAV